MNEERQVPETVSLLSAGVGKVEITTDEEGIVVADPLYVKALVLDDGHKKVVIITMDVTAIGGIGDVSDDFLPNLRLRLEAELGLDGSNVLVNASHTHPPGRLICDDEQQIERTLEAVRQALSDMQPVKTGCGYGSEDSISMNRNLKLEDGKQWTIRHANPSPPDAEVQSVSERDARIGVIRIDKVDGSPFAVIFNFACHPLWGAPRGRITADYPGIATGVIEENLGQGAMAFFLQGAAGDVIDVLFKDFTRPRDVTLHGMKLGLGTLRAYRAITPTSTSLNIVSETIRLPRRTDIPQRIEALLTEQGELLKSLRYNSLNFKAFLPLYLQQMMSPEYPGGHSSDYLQAEQRTDDTVVAMAELNREKVERYLDSIRVMERLTRMQDDIETFERHLAINEESGETTIACEIIGIRIGDCVLISAPIEILSEVGFNVKNASPHEHTFMAAFSNGYMHYGSPAADYDKGGYEVTECLLAPEWQQLYEAKANELLRAL
jgi:hypothetical protein